LISAGDVAPIVIGSILIALAAAFSQTGDRRKPGQFLSENRVRSFSGVPAEDAAPCTVTDIRAKTNSNFQKNFCKFFL
jgi:hypothetical protein